eukprot:scaffold20678_cov69-Cyclotella_meneghiniana.AAC.2
MPITVSSPLLSDPTENGKIGSLFKCFLYGGNNQPLPHFSTDRPNTAKAAKRSISTSTPWGVLNRADKYLKHAHGDKLFGGNYLSTLPNSWADQQLDLTFITNISNHIFSSFKNIKQTSTSPRSSIPSDSDDDYSKYDNEYDWKYHHGDLLGEEWLDDEYHGIDTCDLIGVSVGISVPASHTCDL